MNNSASCKYLIAVQRKGSLISLYIVFMVILKVFDFNGIFVLWALYEKHIANLRLSVSHLFLNAISLQVFCLFPINFMSE